MSLEIVPAEDRSGLRAFIDVPWRLYGAADPWIPPLRVMVRDLLDTRRNPFYRSASRALFLALRDGRPVGRIAAIENRAHNAYHGDRVGFFGFFEAENDPEVARALFGAAGGWLGARGLTAMRGPMSPSTNHECGLLVDGFALEPYFLTPWNPAWYGPLIEGAGLVPEKDLLGYRMTHEPSDFDLSERGRAFAERTRARLGRVEFRQLDARRLGREAELCRSIYNEAWGRNWGFVPMDEGEFAFMAKELKPVLIPEISFIAEVDGEAAGFLVMVGDFNRLFRRIPSGRLLPTGLFTLLAGARRLRTTRALLLGIREKHRHRSILPLFLNELLERGRRAGFVEAEASWVLEDNEALNRPLRSLGARPCKRWRIYRRDL